jgi:cytochrome c
LLSGAEPGISLGASLGQYSNQEVHMNTLKLLLISGVVAVTFWPLKKATADEALAKKNGCFACHAIDHKVVGPAYLDVAAKYKGDSSAVDALTKKVLHGGGGVWGDVPMPPNVAVSPDNARKLVEWILSLNAGK